VAAQLVASSVVLSSIQLVTGGNTPSVNVFHSYSRDGRFESQLEHLTILFEVFHDFGKSLQVNSGIVHNLRIMVY
jgi:hypothetical protein